MLKGAFCCKLTIYDRHRNKYEGHAAWNILTELATLQRIAQSCDFDDVAAGSIHVSEKAICDKRFSDDGTCGETFGTVTKSSR